MSFVEVPAATLLEFLKARGFTERATLGAELVLERSHKADPRYKVLVYTSVRRGNTRARAKGKDAIRVCAIFDDGRVTRGICKLPRVHRTGTVDGVLARVLERMRQAYAQCSLARPKRSAPRVTSIEDAAREFIEHADRVQQKHHPGSRPIGAHAPGFLEGGLSGPGPDEDREEEP